MPVMAYCSATVAVTVPLVACVCFTVISSRKTSCWRQREVMSQWKQRLGTLASPSFCPRPPRAPTPPSLLRGPRGKQRGSAGMQWFMQSRCTCRHCTVLCLLCFCWNPGIWHRKCLTITLVAGVTFLRSGSSSCRCSMGQEVCKWQPWVALFLFLHPLFVDPVPSHAESRSPLACLCKRKRRLLAILAACGTCERTFEMP
jgi:hypothetical protein